MKHCHLYFTENPLPVKSLVLKLCVKMSLANQRLYDSLKCSILREE